MDRFANTNSWLNGLARFGSPAHRNGEHTSPAMAAPKGQALRDTVYPKGIKRFNQELV